MKFEVGKKLESFTCNTIERDGVKLEELTEGKPTMFLFLRYYGCRMCQVDLHDLDENYEAVRSAGGRAVVILQSSREVMKGAAKEKAFHYTIICDPDEKLYKQFEVRTASKKEDLIGGDAPRKIERAVELGLEHGAYEGNELQLPAAVLVDRDMIVRYAHYGENGADIPSVDEIAQLIRKTK